MQVVAFLAALGAAVGLAAAPARAAEADPLKEANRLLALGKSAEALARVEATLAARPDFAQARFLKGVILTEQNKPAEAIAVFSALTQDYPELAEPYNNLAVLYAAQGDYEGARQSLERAVFVQPGYATAQENLGDIYARLALQAYSRAHELDPNNESAEKKRAVLKQLPAPAAAGSGR